MGLMCLWKAENTSPVSPGYIGDDSLYANSHNGNECYFLKYKYITWSLRFQCWVIFLSSLRDCISHKHRQYMHCIICFGSFLCILFQFVVHAGSVFSWGPMLCVTSVAIVRTVCNQLCFWGGWVAIIWQQLHQVDFIDLSCFSGALRVFERKTAHTAWVSLWSLLHWVPSGCPGGVSWQGFLSVPLVDSPHSKPRSLYIIIYNDKILICHHTSTGTKEFFSFRIKN